MAHYRIRGRTAGIGAGALALALLAVPVIGVSMAGTAAAAGAPSAATLNPNVAPGGNFDLSRWELQLPIGSAGSPTTILPSSLEGANGFQDSYFFTDTTDGSMSFWDPENGVTTPNSNYARSELREMNADGSAANWSIPGTHTLSATVKSTEIPDHVCVGQIHLGQNSTSTKPLAELYYYSNGQIVLGIEDSPSGGQTPHTITSVPLGTQWSYVLGLSGGNTINLTVNGTKQSFAMPSSFTGYPMYFKAGDYDQSSGSSSTVGAAVQFYALSVYHSTGGGSTAPATPSGLAVSGATSSSLNLAWTEANNSDPAVSYKVYEGSTVVATSTTTSTTITGLASGSSHTYTVTAVDSAGVESTRSASANGTTSGSTGGGNLSVTIAKTKDFGVGYTDTATVTNSTGSAMTGWNVQFDLDPSENIESSANVTYTNSGNHYTLTNTSSDATIPAGSTLTFQFSGDYGSSYIAPTNVAVS
ncbi:polysaccharide lyase family 7 protein [Actinospica sp.]|jgi:hypothetical protein|uniref:polysaccharide lyase family 7 protein n=1 Tax=Actinospica sp. TaxID=1872142 RepID=UPI002C4322D0|nr:polysaccharide lyase family 7 protein [Actinospica sp.]HWG25687.1 polysaccharide lyase family 7 protein [Actinospica sp.]